jgi:DNA-binding transcriptional regulator YiaG
MIKKITSSEELVALRSAVGMTQRQFADYFHMSYRNIQNWENGVSAFRTYIFSLMKYKLICEGLYKDDK